MAKQKPKRPKLTNEHIMGVWIPKIKRYCVNYIAYLQKIIDICDLELESSDTGDPEDTIFDSYHRATISAIKEQKRDCQILLRLTQITEGEYRPGNIVKFKKMANRLFNEFLSYKTRVFGLDSDVAALLSYLADILDDDDSDDFYGIFDGFDDS